MKKRKILLTLWSIIVLMPITISVACNDNKNVIKYNDDGKIVNWNNKLKIFNKDVPISFTWDANKTETIADMMDQINDEIHFIPIKKIFDFNAFDFASFIVKLYNNTNAGHAAFTIKYKGNVDIVKFDFHNLAKELIDSFNTKDNNITKKTMNVTIANISDAIKTFIKKDIDISYIFQKFGILIPVVFGTNNIAKILTDTNLSYNTYKLLGLLSSFPKVTINKFGNLIGIINEMSSKFTMSSLAQKWAKDNNLVKEFNDFASAMIKTIIYGG